jgi:hypothetical protein
VVRTSSKYAVSPGLQEAKLLAEESDELLELSDELRRSLGGGDAAEHHHRARADAGVEAPARERLLGAGAVHPHGEVTRSQPRAATATTSHGGRRHPVAFCISSSQPRTLEGLADAKTANQADGSGLIQRSPNCCIHSRSTSLARTCVPRT